MEASMQGLFDKSGETVSRFYRRWGTGVFALPVLVIIALVGLVIPRPVPSNWISDAVKAEFAGTKLGPEAAAARPSKAATEIRTVKAY
jgi:hypothetical protein